MRKQRLIIIIGILLAVGSAWGMYKYAAELEKKLPVIVAKKTINQLDKFSDDNLEIIQMPPRYILPGAYASLEQATGKTAGAKIYPGEQIIPDKIARDQIILNENERLLFIPCNNVLMKPRQKVDIYIVYQPGKSAKTGAHVVLKEKVIANVIDERGASIYIDSKSVLDISKRQAGVEIIATTEEISDYLAELLYAKETVVRYGEGVIQ